MAKYSYLHFLALPIFSLIMNAMSWLKFGINIPFMDDWRAIESNNMGKLNLSYLFGSSNDTLYPVGKVLDSLSDRYLNSNVVAYQFISLVCVLGALLFLQWRLLLLALNDRLLAASAFVLTLFMLQPDTYWGAQYLAYHQALPLVFSLSAIYVILAMRWHSQWSPFALILLGLLSGFSYITGSFSILTLGCIFIVAFYFIQTSERKPLLHGGLALLTSSLITVPAQMWVLVIQQGSHLPTTPMAYPYQGDFWLYFLGKIGRALMLPSGEPWISLIITLFATFTIIGLVIGFIKLFRKGYLCSLLEARAPLIFIALSCMIFVYLCLISAGRAHHGQPTMAGIIDVFSMGFHRFHFFWVTLLWPWLAAVIFITISKKSASTFAIIMPIVLVPYLLLSGAFKHGSTYKVIAEQLEAGVRCLTSKIQTTQKINCPILYPADLTTAILYAKQYGASFIQTIPFSHMVIGDNSNSVLLQLSKTSVDNIKFNNAKVLSHNKNIFNIKSNLDPMIYLKTNFTREMNACKILEVSAELKVSSPDIAQLFYLTTDQINFSEESSVTVSTVANGEFNKIYFLLTSPNGFSNNLRFDPVTQPQQIELKELEITCKRT